VTNGLKILAESLIIRKIQYIVINYINLFVFDDEIEMKNRSTIQTLTFVTFCTNKSGPFIHETGSGTCNYPVSVRKKWLLVKILAGRYSIQNGSLKEN
jgi:hypothetical protein